MTTIEDLADTIHTAHDISLDAARDAVRVHVDQITDDPDLWNPDTETLTDTGVGVITYAIAESYRQGIYGTTAQRLLDEIGDTARELREAKSAADAIEEKRDDLIRRAMRPGSELRPKDIAAAADLKPARLYQIRDGRR